MTLNKIRLLNFRNHKDFRADFNQLNVIHGPNASGKTNLLEAIYLLSTTKSFRSSQNQNLISFGRSFCRVEGEVIKEDKKLILEIIISENRKTGRLDKKPKRPIFLLGKFPTVLFTPETLNLVLGPPPIRRRAMDLILIQVSRKYLQNLVEFSKILHQRNRLLFKIKEGRAKAALLDFWDEGFLRTSLFLREVRESFLVAMNKFLPIGLRLLYQPSAPEGLEKTLANFKNREIEAGFSLWGPQKDDFSFIQQGRALADFGSRGEVREGTILFKLAEWRFIKEKTSFQPVLLLDDIFAELDKKKREKLIPLVFQGQTILTTTSISSLNPKIIKNARAIEL